MNPQDKFIHDMDARFVSGNSVPVRDARITWEEWQQVRADLIALYRPTHYAATEQGRAWLGGVGR